MTSSFSFWQPYPDLFSCKRHLRNFYICWIINSWNTNLTHAKGAKYTCLLVFDSDFNFKTFSKLLLNFSQISVNFIPIGFFSFWLGIINLFCIQICNWKNEHKMFENLRKSILKNQSILKKGTVLKLKWIRFWILF